MAFKERAAALKHELEAEKQRAAKAKEEAEVMYSERLRVELQAQSLKYERRVMELESGGAVGSAGATAVLRPGGSMLDYIPRAEHLRLLEMRLAAKDADIQTELNSRVAQVEREWQWKLESKEAEIASLTARARQLEDDMHTERQRAASHAHKLGDEAKRLEARCVELQRELEAQAKEAARLKEILKDARSANADMDDDALSSTRQVARLRHALEDSQGALKEAQATLAAERKRGDGARREAEAAGERAEEAARRCERLAGEAVELQAALEQKSELVAALQAESDAWSAKLMAHREYHEQEVETLRRAAREDAEARVAVLEQQCAEVTAELRTARKQHEEAVAKLADQHAEEVSQLQTQLAAAERCSAELRHVTATLGSVRHEDVEALRNAVQELQLRLKEAVYERDAEREAHATRLAAMAGQVAARLAGFKGQQAQLKAEVEGEVAAACAEALAGFESGLATLTKQLEEQAAAAEAQHAALAERGAAAQGALEALLGALRSEVPALPEGPAGVLLKACGSDSDAATASPKLACQQELKTAALAVAAAVAVHTERAEAAAVHAALAALEGEMLPAAAPAPASASPRKLLSSPSRRRQADAEEAARQQVAACPNLEAAEGRLAALLARSRQLLGHVAAGEGEVAALRQRVAEVEAAAAAYADKFGQAKVEGAAAAEAARAAAVAPLQAEVARLTERVQSLQQLHAAELAAIEAAARQQVAAAQAAAQTEVDRLSSAGTNVQAQLRGESARAEGLAADLSRLQEELARHSQRAAAKIELQSKEVDMLKGRVREMESRDAANQAEIRALRQREREAAQAAALVRG